MNKYYKKENITLRITPDYLKSASYPFEKVNNVCYNFIKCFGRLF
jgi:hypothetical protein